jgi:uncharacterized protein
MLPCSTRHILAVLSLALLLLEGCGSTPPTRFYVLPTLTDASPPAAAGKRELTIGIGPVTLPPYLDRPQIVTRASRARLILGEFDQWGAPLHDSVTRSLAENLSLLVPTDRVVLHPWSRTTVPDYQVTLEVLQFDAGPGGEVILAARWQILNTNEKALIMRKSRLTAAAGGHSHGHGPHPRRAQSGHCRSTPGYHPARVVMKWTRPLCGSAAMSQNDFKTSETIQPQEASPVKPHISVLGIDIAKRIFHIVGMNERGQIVLRKRLSAQI